MCLYVYVVAFVHNSPVTSCLSVYIDEVVLQSSCYYAII